VLAVSHILSHLLHAGANLHNHGRAAVFRIGVLWCFAALFVVGGLLFLFSSVWIFAGMAVCGTYVAGSMCRDSVSGSGVFAPFSVWRTDEAEMRNEIAFGAVSFAPILGGLAVAVLRSLFDGAGQ